MYNNRTNCLHNTIVLFSKYTKPHLNATRLHTMTLQLRTQAGQHYCKTLGKQNGQNKRLALNTTYTCINRKALNRQPNLMAIEHQIQTNCTSTARTSIKSRGARSTPGCRENDISSLRLPRPVCKLLEPKWIRRFIRRFVLQMKSHKCFHVKVSRCVPHWCSSCEKADLPVCEFVFIYLHLAPPWTMSDVQ